MKPNVHVHLVVSNLDRSAAFYEALFGTPVKSKPGYRKFLPSFAPLNLAMSEHPPAGSAQPAVSHLGIQFDTPQEVQAQLARVKALEIPVREEIGVSCCHANQDKFWVRDPDGVEWEFYNLNFDIEEEVPVSATTGCCAPASQGGKGSCGV
jgi:catechol 2,3-dioxygenase-like lactoylglutathione lyase family enzyme